MKAFENKTVVITGGTSGIGKATALAFSQQKGRKGRSYKIYVENMDAGLVCVDESGGNVADDALKTRALRQSTTASNPWIAAHL